MKNRRLLKIEYRRKRLAFTLIEILVVVAIIGILLGIVAIAGFGLLKSATRSAIQVQINGLSSGLTAYKLDNGAYPQAVNLVGPGYSAPIAPADSSYVAASINLYTNLAGSSYYGGPLVSKNYYKFSLSQVGSPTANTYIIDGFGYSLGYSTQNNNTGTNNFDIWSVGGPPSSTSGTNSWITNWQ